MNRKSLKLPIIIFVIGLIACVAVYVLTGLIRKPTVTEHDFEFTVTYKLNGETKTYDGVYRCEYYVSEDGDYSLERFYYGEFLTGNSEYNPGLYVIDTVDDMELCIVVIFSDYLLMDDAEYDDAHYDPYIALFDNMGSEYDNLADFGEIDAEIVDWEYPEPVDNSFKVVGLSRLHEGSMTAMLLVAILVIVACAIFVRRDKSRPYKVLDWISFGFNFGVGIIGIPFITLIAALTQIYASGDELMYQILFCVPAISAFTIAASLSLRRKGYSKTGFIIQFVGPAMFVLIMVLEYVMVNIFG